MPQNPYSGYGGKAAVGHYHTLRPVLKDCLPVDDQVFPLLYSDNEPDRVFRLRGVDGLGDIFGPDVEYHIFRAGTGIDWPQEELDRAVARIYNLERALQIRHWNRSRSVDETVLPFFEQEDSSQNPLLEQRYRLDRDKFQPVVNEFYRLHGWDERGIPTSATLAGLGLADIESEMAVEK